MKKRLPVIIAIVAAVAILVLAGITIFRDARFELSNEYYGSGEIVSITPSELEDKISHKKSFLLFVLQPACPAAEDFQKILESFLVNHPLTIFSISFSELKDNHLNGKIQFYPSLAIYREGEMVEFLETDNDDHTAAYTSLDGLQVWLEKHITLRG